MPGSNAPLGARAKAQGLTLMQKAGSLPPERQYTVFLVALFVAYVLFLWYIARGRKARSTSAHEVVHVVIDNPPHASSTARESVHEAAA